MSGRAGAAAAGLRRLYAADGCAAHVFVVCADVLLARALVAGLMDDRGLVVGGKGRR